MSDIKKRLSVEDWLLAGFRSLTTKGPESLKAEPLARELGTTKGSFYWHFKDVPAFKSHMLSYWEEHALDAVVSKVQTEADPVKQLQILGDLATTTDPAYGGAAAEPAIRAWGQSNSDVAAAVARIDEKRMAFLREILSDLGLTNPELAQIAYAAYIGLGALEAAGTDGNANAMSTLFAAFLALRDA